MNRLDSRFTSRRDFLARAFNGLGLLALGDLLGAEGPSPFAPRKPHLPRKAKRCIFLFMQGGVSQVDSFEHKPALEKFHGKRIPNIPKLSGELQGRLTFPHVCVASPFKFKKHGQSGRDFSELLPNLAGHADELAFIHGIENDNQNHGPATLQITTGSQFPGGASVGSWVNYGLGTTNRNMPGYVVIQDPRGAPVNGAAVWGNGFLPAAHQGTLLRAKGTPILNLERPVGLSSKSQRDEFDALKWLNQKHLAQRQADHVLEARINAYELAYRMQSEAPALMDISREPAHIQQLYGMDNGATAGFGRQCLLARRMIESGVRYTMLVHGVQIGGASWDDHGNVKAGMIRHSREVDKPVAGLLTDLKQRGLLKDTLVVWASEMGRTSFKNGGLGKNPGRDHNGRALVMWMAGGNVKAGATAGKTDEFSLRSVGESIHIRDVHATLLDLMGLDSERLEYLHGGRQRKLTNTGGSVLKEIIA